MFKNFQLMNLINWKFDFGCKLLPLKLCNFIKLLFGFTINLNIIRVMQLDFKQGVQIIKSRLMSGTIKKRRGRYFLRCLHPTRYRLHELFFGRKRAINITTLKTWSFYSSFVDKSFCVYKNSIIMSQLFWTFLQSFSEFIFFILQQNVMLVLVDDVDDLNLESCYFNTILFCHQITGLLFDQTESFGLGWGVSDHYLAESVNKTDYLLPICGYSFSLSSFFYVAKRVYKLCRRVRYFRIFACWILQNKKLTGKNLIKQWKFFHRFFRSKNYYLYNKKVFAKTFKEFFENYIRSNETK